MVLSDGLYIDTLNLMPRLQNQIRSLAAFGKTVACSYLISERKVSTLILLQSKDLLSQWVEELHRFLEINEEPPEYETKTGRKKRRDSAIGVLQAVQYQHSRDN